MNRWPIERTTAEVGRGRGENEAQHGVSETLFSICEALVPVPLLTEVSINSQLLLFHELVT